MSYVSSSSILSDRSRFQSFWRTYPSDNSANNAFLAVIQQYGWTQLKILTQEETLFIEVCFVHSQPTLQDMLLLHTQHYVYR